MKRGGGVHTVPADNRPGWWWNKVDGKILSRHRNKDVAIAAGRAAAIEMGAEHTIHRGDGVITEKNSYGNDSFPPRG